MADIMRECLKKAKLDRVKQRRALAWLLVLSMLTSFGVMWQMHGVGEAQSVKYVCGLDEHTHMDSCYPSNIICSLEEDEGHTHTEDCYTQQEGIVCEVEAHTHDENCYSPVDELVCPLHETPGHTHVEECYGDITQYACASAEHTHADACYTVASTVQCGQAEIPAHHHSDSCYTTQKDLVCGQAETSAHQHGEGCYTSQLNLTCTLAEDENHAHTDACYTASQTLTCPLAQTEGHAHSDACYTTSQALTCAQEETEGHTHDASCTKEERMLICTAGEHTHTETCGATTSHGLICGLEEEESHTHTADCFQTNSALTCMLPEHDHVEECMGLVDQLICDKTEQEPHTHDDSCYAYGRLNCGLEHEHTAECYVKQALACGLEHEEHVADCYVDFAICGQIEHTHDAECTSNPEADLVTRSGWEASVPKSLTGVWSNDLLTVAASQLGFGESTQNFVIDENGQRQGYNRYGAFYSGSDEGAYGEWSAKFVAFCLHYAGVKGVSTNSGAYAWFVQLSNSGALAADAVMKPGDLVFLDCSGNGRVDRVAIVSDSDNATFVAVYEGDAPDGTVRWHTYALTGENAVSLMGIYHLPENPALAPMETTAPVVETTGADQETTAATEENTVSTEETTAPTEETTVPTEESSESAGWGSYGNAVAGADLVSGPTKARWTARAASDDDIMPAAETSGSTVGTSGNPYNINTSVTSVVATTYKDGKPMQELSLPCQVGTNGITGLAFKMNYMIPQGTLDESRPYAIYTLPNGLKVNDAAGDVLKKDGTRAGTFVLENGVLKITYDQSFAESNKSSAIEGYFNLNAKSFSEILNGKEEGKIEFSNDLVFTLKDESQKDLWVNKKANVREEADGYYIDYTVEMRTNTGTGSEVTFLDIIKGLPETAAATDIKVETGWNGEIVQNHNLEFKNGEITGTLPAITGQGRYLVKYTVKVDPSSVGDMENNGKVTNTAKFSTNKITQEATKEVELKNRVDVVKTQVVAPDDSNIVYTITVKSPYGTNGKPVILTDTMADFQKYIKDLTDGKFDTSAVTVTSNKQGTVTPVYENTGSDLFKATLPAMQAGEEYTITYTANLNDILGNVNISNTAKVEVENIQGGTSSTNHQIDQSIIGKTGTVENGQIKWTITVNTDRINIAGMSLTDILKDSPLKQTDLAPDTSVTITPADAGVDPSQIWGADGSLNITFQPIGEDGKNTNQYVIEYFTPLNNGFGENSAPSNSASLGGVGTGPVTPEGWEPWNPGEKTGTPGDLDVEANTFPINWTVKLDASQGAIGKEGEAWIIEDAPENQEITYEQMLGIQSALNAAIENLKLESFTYSISVRDDAWQTYSFDASTVDRTKKFQSFTIQFEQPLPQGNILEFTYQTTGKWEEWGNYTNRIDIKVDNKTITITGNSDKPNKPSDPNKYLPTLNKSHKDKSTLDPVSGDYIWDVALSLPYNGLTSADIPGEGFTLYDIIPDGVDISSIYLTGDASITAWNGEERVGYSKIYDIAKGDTTLPGETTVSLYLHDDQNGQFLFPDVADWYKATRYDIPVKIEKVEGGTKISLQFPKEVYNSTNGYSINAGHPIELLIGVNIDVESLITNGSQGEYVSYKVDFNNTAHVKFDTITEEVDSNTDTIHLEDGDKVLDKVVADRNKTNVVPYEIDVNSKADDLLPNEKWVTLTDNLYYEVSSEGISSATVNLIPSSLRVYDVCHNNRLLSPGSGYTATLETTVVDGKTHHILTLKIPDDHHLKVAYNYEILGRNGSDVKLHNTAILSGGDWWGNQQETSIDKTYQEQTAGADTNSITVVKADADAVSFTLKNAEFQLYKYTADSGWGDPLGTYTTGYGGTFSLGIGDSGLAANELYKLVETKTPIGYEIVKAPDGKPLDTHYFYIEKKGTSFTLPEGCGATLDQVSALTGGGKLTILNVRNKQNVTLMKVRADDMVTPVTGVRFSVEKFEDGAWKPVAENLGVTDNGMAIITEASTNVVYRVKETFTPEGFIPASDYIYFYVPEDGQTPIAPEELKENGSLKDGVIQVDKTLMTVSIKNEVPDRLSLKKVDAADANTILGGAKFKLYKWNYDKRSENGENGTNEYGGFVEVTSDLITGENGILDLSTYITYNTAYRLEEIEAPAGYIKTDTAFEFYIQSNDEDQFPWVKPWDEDHPGIIRVDNGHQFVFTNSKGTIETTEITVTKKWQNSDGIELGQNPANGSATVQLMQVSTSSGDTGTTGGSSESSGSVTFDAPDTAHDFSIACPASATVTVTFRAYCQRTYSSYSAEEFAKAHKPGINSSYLIQEYEPVVMPGTVHGDDKDVEVTVDYAYKFKFDGKSETVQVSLEDILNRGYVTWSHSASIDSGNSGGSGESGSTPSVGEPYGDSVTLNQDNNWTYKFSNLPKDDGNGNTYTYYIKETSGIPVEVKHDGTSVSATESFVNGEFILYNQLEKTFEVKKVDKEDGSKLLSGAEFKLYTVNVENGVYSVSSEPVGSYTTSNGVLSFNGYSFVEGQLYMLEETIAPNGYQLPDNPKTFFKIAGANGSDETVTLGDDTYTVTLVAKDGTLAITNEKLAAPKVSVKKLDVNTDTVLQGAEFVLEKAKVNYGGDGSIWVSYENCGRLTTGWDGKLTFENLEYDTPYRLYETSAPAGYMLNYQAYYFVIPSDTSKIGTSDQAYIDYLHDTTQTQPHNYLVDGEVIPFKDRPLDTKTSINVEKQWSDGSDNHNAIQVKLHQVKADYVTGSRPDGYVALSFMDQNDPETTNFEDRAGFVPVGSTVKFRVVFARDDEDRRKLDAKVDGQMLAAESSGALADGMYQYTYELKVDRDTKVNLFLAGEGSYSGNRYGEYGHPLWYLEFLDIQAPLPSQSSSSGGSESSNPSDTSTSVPKYHLSLENSKGDDGKWGDGYKEPNLGDYAAGTVLRVKITYTGSGKANEFDGYLLNHVGYWSNSEKKWYGIQNQVSGDFPADGVITDSFTVKEENIQLQLQAFDNNPGTRNWKAEVIVVSTPESAGSGSTTTTSPRDSVISQFDLSNDDGWKKSITDLPKVSYDGQGNPTYYTYYVEEIKVDGFTTTYYVDGVATAPENLAGTAISDGKTIVIKNTKDGDTPTYELPKTGSIGTLPFTLLGLTLMGAPIGYAADQHLRKRKSRKTK